jgi:hypothetical protein
MGVNYASRHDDEDDSPADEPYAQYEASLQTEEFLDA